MKRLIYIFAILFVIAAIAGYAVYRYAGQAYDGTACDVYVHSGDTVESFERELSDSLGESFGAAVFKIWKFRGGKMSKAHGHYRVKPGENAYGLAMRLRGGAQNPVSVTIPNNRSFDKVLEVTASQFDFSADELEEALDSLIAHDRGLEPVMTMAFVLPDTYQYYWTAKPEYVAKTLVGNWDSFWNESRRAKAEKLNLTPVQVSVLASIVEEESAKLDERPVIARLYLNRLKRGMKLQADPTVKYAVGDPTLKRILNIHLSTPSRYNTYIIDGLPPSPIRPVDKSTLDAVLDAPEHDYLYMCAKDDFSGYHNFARTHSEHAANARRYHAALSRLNIK